MFCYSYEDKFSIDFLIYFVTRKNAWITISIYTIYYWPKNPVFIQTGLQFATSLYCILCCIDLGYIVNCIHVIIVYLLINMQDRILWCIDLGYIVSYINVIIVYMLINMQVPTINNKSRQWEKSLENASSLVC